MSSQLPRYLTRFIGREQEIGDIRRLLLVTRLLTLSGPGGCGKTRLAIKVARAVEETYEDGLIWVDLAAIAEESLVAQAVAKAAGMAEQPGRSFREALAGFLSDAQLLLVLDNCEHLVTAAARLAGSLLSACPDLHLLTTSREPLALAGETVYPVPALSFPTDDLLARTSSLVVSADFLEALQGYEAISLLLDRAMAVIPDYALTAENARAVSAICRRLDGMPLAIELAAARVNVLTAEQLVRRLKDQFALLVSHQRGGIAERHQTLRAAIDWSYDLLSASEQLLLQRLSVFAGRCTLATVEAVCTGEGVKPEQLLELLSSLVNKSLVVAETLRLREARYHLLQTIRQYAAEKLQATGGQPTLRDKHLRCYRQLVEETEPKLNGAYQQLWLDWLEDEVDNIRAALSWSLESDQIESGLRIAAALYQFWTIRDYREEGLSWYERLLAQPNEGVAAAVRVNALAYASLMASFSGQTETQIRYADEAVRVGEVAGEAGKQAFANALAARAYAARRTGDVHRALVLGLREIEVNRQLGDPYRVGLGLCYYSFMAMSLAQYDRAHAMLDEGLPMLRETGNPYRIAMALNYKGDLARCEENYAEAMAAYDESIMLLRDIKAARDLASALHNQGHAYLHSGNAERARSLFRESMTIHQAQQNTLGMAECLLGFAALALADQVPAAGVRLLAAAEAIGGRHITKEWAATRLEYEHYLQRARAGLAGNVFMAEQAAGQRLSLEQAVAYAFETADKGATTRAARQMLDELTPREREVAILVAQAKPNDVIAQQLVVSRRTVESHISHILTKLGFTNRAQIVRWAVESGLLTTTE